MAWTSSNTAVRNAFPPVPSADVGGRVDVLASGTRGSRSSTSSAVLDPGSLAVAVAVPCAGWSDDPQPANGSATTAASTTAPTLATRRGAKPTPRRYSSERADKELDGGALCRANVSLRLADEVEQRTVDLVWVGPGDVVGSALHP